MAFVLLLARGLIRVLSWLPQWLVDTLAAILGRLVYWLPWRKHLVIERNLALCFPDWSERERKALHRRYLRALFRLAFEARVLWHWDEARIRKLITVESGEELLDASHPSPTGTLFVSGHFGNWELLNLRISMQNVITTLYRAPANTHLDRFINQPRTRFGARMVPGDRAAIKNLLLALRKGDAAAIAADIQPKRGDGVFVPFFGIETLTMTLVHKLARKTGCRVVLTDLRRKPKGPGWRMSLLDASDWMQCDDPRQALGRVNQWLEERIRESPEDYLWLYKRFSKRPDGEAERYPGVRKKRRTRSRPPSSGD